MRPAQTGGGYFSIIVISNDNQESNTDNTDQTTHLDCKDTIASPSHPRASLGDNYNDLSLWESMLSFNFNMKCQQTSTHLRF